MGSHYLLKFADYPNGSNLLQMLVALSRMNDEPGGDSFK
jgi:hypothetical protein